MTSLLIPSPAAIRTIRRNLLNFYDHHARTLPWRAKSSRKPNPYHVLVSEAMLQQTQVATVIDYFNRFIKELPTINHLARASEQKVLRLWQGLGYYRRARNLHAAAGIICSQHDSQIPQSPDQLQSLPGVGRYTAGAIASIAFNQPAPIVDGNIKRLFARLFAIDMPLESPPVTRHLWLIAKTLVPKTRPGDFNQALMELGATICTPNSPQCDHCPLAGQCEAFKNNLTSKLPVTASRKKPTPVTHHILAIRKDNQYLFQQRPPRGLWSNMWQLPTLETDNTPESLDKKQPAALRRWAKQQLNLSITSPKQIHLFTHQTSHRTITFILYRATRTAGRRPADTQWRTLTSLSDLPLPNPQRLAVKHLL